MSDRALVAFEVPAADLAEFGRLPDACRADIRLKLECMRELARAAKRERAGIYGRYAVRLQKEVQTMRHMARKYFEATRSQGAGAWRELRDLRKWPEAEECGNIPPRARRWIHDLVRKYRTVSQARRVGLSQWVAWGRGDSTKVIPGYTECPKASEGSQHPAGWSERNWQTIAKAEVPRWERSARRIGTGSVHKELAQVLTTRVNTYPGHAYQFDDMIHNFQGLCLLGKSVVRLAQFGAVDVHSGCFFEHAIKPRQPREDGSIEDLNEKEFRYFLAHVLTEHGYSERGTLLMMENAKTTIGKGKTFEKYSGILHGATDGLVRCELAPLGKQPLVSKWWKGESGGNWAFKGLIEKLHDYIQNHTEALTDAQVGRGRDDRPEWLGKGGAMYKEHERIVKAIAARPELVDELRSPFMRVDRLIPMIAEIYRRVNGRTQHEIEDWAALGYVVQEYRTPAGLWISHDEALALPVNEQERLRVALATDARRHTRERRLSPAEVWNSRRGFRRLPDVAAYMLIADDFEEEDVAPEAGEAEEAGGYLAARSFFKIKRREGNLYFETRVRTAKGEELELPLGRRYKVIPFGARAFVADLDGGFIGTAQAVQRVCPMDAEALREQFGRKRLRVADQLAHVRADMEADAEAVAEMKAHNDGVMSGPDGRSGPDGADGRRGAGKGKGGATEDLRDVLLSKPLPERSDEDHWI